MKQGKIKQVAEEQLPCLYFRVIDNHAKPNKVPIDMDQVIRTNDSVSQKVFLLVFSSFLIFFKMLTRFKQKMIAGIGIKNMLIYIKITKLLPPNKCSGL
ncbi:hypothetical protein AAFN87_15930 [Solibacillus sp. CAU 1738]